MSHAEESKVSALLAEFGKATETHAKPVSTPDERVQVSRPADDLIAARIAAQDAEWVEGKGFDPIRSTVEASKHRGQTRNAQRRAMVGEYFSHLFA